MDPAPVGGSPEHTLTRRRPLPHDDMCASQNDDRMLRSLMLHCRRCRERAGTAIAG